MSCVGFSPTITLRRDVAGEIKGSRAVLGGRRRDWGSVGSKGHEGASVCGQHRPHSLVKTPLEWAGTPATCSSDDRDDGGWRKAKISRATISLKLLYDELGLASPLGEKRVFFFSMICMSLIMKSNFEHANDLSGTSTSYRGAFMNIMIKQSV